MKTIKYTYLILIVIGLLIVSGCQPAVTQTAAPSPEETSGEQVLVIATEGIPPTLDPLDSNDSRVDTPSINFYSTLTQFEYGTTNLKMELAETSEVSEDGLSHTFTIKKGVKFHDGSELTASDVVYTIDRMIALGTGVYGNMPSITGGEAVDGYTVKINMAQSFPGLEGALTRLYIVNADVVKENEQNGDWGQQWLSTNETGSGPYTLSEFQSEQQLTVEKFPDYFKGWEGNHVDRAIFRVIREEATRQISLENGEVDWIYIGIPDTWEGLKGKEGIILNQDETLNQLYFAFNNQNEFLKDVRIRKALELAFDYQGLVEQVLNGHAVLAKGPNPESILCHDPSMEVTEYNIEKAKELMAEAGFPDGGFELSMVYEATTGETDYFNVMQAGASALGITLIPLEMEWDAKVNAFSSPETAPAMGTIWQFPPYPDPDQYVWSLVNSKNIGGGGTNFAYYSNPRMDELTNAGKSELDPAKRCEIYKQVQQIWTEDVPYANVIIMESLSAQKDYVNGYKWTSPHPLTQQVYHMWLDRKP